MLGSFRFGLMTSQTFTSRTFKSLPQEVAGVGRARKLPKPSSLLFEAFEVERVTGTMFLKPLSPPLE